ncbi:hypothetical protein ACH4HG_00570 [Streptomyces coeruleorubidus]|uniref:hypothetical protein n=1 Tax=Streptomyces coeruleorubidus TaxID=116188 RepID=UPI0037B45420
MTEAASQRAAARRIQLLIGISIVCAVAMAPISMLIARSAPEDSQGVVVRHLMGAALLMASCLIGFAVIRSRLSSIEPDGIAFQVVFGSIVMAGCGTIAGNLIFIATPLVPALLFWLLRRIPMQGTAKNRDEN